MPLATRPTYDSGHYHNKGTLFKIGRFSIGDLYYKKYKRGSLDLLTSLFSTILGKSSFHDFADGSHLGLMDILTLGLFHLADRICGFTLYDIDEQSSRTRALYFSLCWPVYGVAFILSFAVRAVVGFLLTLTVCIVMGPYLIWMHRNNMARLDSLGPLSEEENEALSKLPREQQAAAKESGYWPNYDDSLPLVKTETAWIALLKCRLTLSQDCSDFNHLILEISHCGTLPTSGELSQDPVLFLHFIDNSLNHHSTLKLDIANPSQLALLQTLIKLDVYNIATYLKEKDEHTYVCQYLASRLDPKDDVKPSTTYLTVLKQCVPNHLLPHDVLEYVLYPILPSYQPMFEVLPRTFPSGEYPRFSP